FNIDDSTVLDYTTGIEDLNKKLIRVIGDPSERYREDPARMLRAIRLAAKLGFKIEDESAKAIRELRNLIKLVPPARLFDKMLKIFHGGRLRASFQLLQDFDVFSVLYPQVSEAIQNPELYQLVENAFENTDMRINQNQSVNSAFLFAVLFWCPIVKRQRE